MGDVVEFKSDDRERRKLLIAIGDLTHMVMRTTDPLAKASLKAQLDQLAERLEALERSQLKANGRS